MIRHSSNPNLTLYYDNFFRDLPIMVHEGPCILEYLERLYKVVRQACNQYQRIFAFRFDLQFPYSQNIHDFSVENGIMDRFFESLKAKIRHNREMALRKNAYAHDTVVRYAWAREVGKLAGHTHYHCVILLNWDAFRTLGQFDSELDTIFKRLLEAWASALCLSVNDVLGLVAIPKDDACYPIHRDNEDSISNFFYGASYLCKADTKVYGNGHHGFGASRI